MPRSLSGAISSALYEEVINVPLFISFPEQRANGQTTPVTLPYVCSAVDILPFIYSMALGNESWRSYPNDMVYYLNNREAIVDAIMQWNGQYTCNNQLIRQRRISTIPLANPPGGSQPWQLYQPYVLHTADDYAGAYYVTPSGSVTTTPQPSHALAFRTADPTGFTAATTGCPSPPVPVNGATLYRGGKLGIYSYWNTCNPAVANAPIKPIDAAHSVSHPQYEFYNYNSSSSPNVREIMNDYFDSSGNVTTDGANYNNAFNATAVQSELYQLNPFGQTGGLATQQVQAAIQDAYDNYILWLTCESYITGADGTFINDPMHVPPDYTCPTEPASSPLVDCPTCATSPGCSPTNYNGGPS